MTTATTTDTVGEREARRRSLAKAAASGDAAQAAVRATGDELRAHDEAEKKRRLEADAKRKEIHKRRGAALGRAQAAADALEKLRQEFVPLDVRQAVSLAKREVDQAKLALTHAEQDAAGARQALAEIKDRIAKVPSGASRARIATAKAALEAATTKLGLAQGACDAAMAAARAL
jgi:hypothetical protein